MTRCLLWAAVVLLGLAPAGALVGVWLALGAGWGVCAGSVGYGALGVFLLTADLIPNPQPAPREVDR